MRTRTSDPPHTGQVLHPLADVLATGLPREEEEVLPLLRHHHRRLGPAQPQQGVGQRHVGPQAGPRPEPFNATTMGVNSISSGSPHVRPMGRTCGEPDEIKKNTHPKNILPLFFASRRSSPTTPTSSSAPSTTLRTTPRSRSPSAPSSANTACVRTSLWTTGSSRTSSTSASATAWSVSRRAPPHACPAPGARAVRVGPRTRACAGADLPRSAGLLRCKRGACRWGRGSAWQRGAAQRVSGGVGVGRLLTS